MVCFKFSCFTQLSFSFYRLRPIVIDGPNVAFEHGRCSLGRPNAFSCRGIDLVVEYFKRRGHADILVFVPRFRLKAGQALDQNVLKRLEKSNNLLFTPSRTIPGKGSFTSYDDR